MYMNNVYEQRTTVIGKKGAGSARPYMDGSCCGELCGTGERIAWRLSACRLQDTGIRSNVCCFQYRYLVSESGSKDTYLVAFMRSGDAIEAYLTLDNL